MIEKLLRFNTTNKQAFGVLLFAAVSYGLTYPEYNTSITYPFVVCFCVFKSWGFNASNATISSNQTGFPVAYVLELEVQGPGRLSCPDIFKY